MKQQNRQKSYFMTLIMILMIVAPLVSVGASNARSTPCTSTVCLNEVMPNPNGYDDAAWPGGEWAEIKNTGSVAVDVLNWQLKNSNGKTLTFDSNSIVGYDAANSSTWIIQPGDWMVIARNANNNFYMTNSQDSMELHDANGTVVDEASWSSASSGTSYVEDPADAYADWVTSAGPTPGSSNSGAQAPVYFASDLIISEVMPNPWPSFDNASWPGGEWVEIYNSGNSGIDVSGWTLTDSAGNVLTMNETHMIGYDPGDSATWILGPSEYAIVSANGTGNYGILNNGQEELFLNWPNGTISEKVSWTSALSGMSLIKDSNGNMKTSVFPTQGLDNAAPISSIINTSSPVSLNEVLPNSTADGNFYSSGGEWLEIYNNGSSPIDLSGWSIIDGIGNVTWMDNAMVGAGTTIDAEDYRLVQFVGGTELWDYFNHLCLVDASGNIVDVLHWDTNHGLNISLVRQEDISDPWIPAAHNTPGSENPSTGTVSEAEVLISEVMSNPAGNDTSDWPNGEWIELLNIGEDDVDLAGWKLQAGGFRNLAINTERALNQDDLIISPGEYLVVAVNSSSSFYLRNSNGDSLSLMDNSGTTIQTAVWSFNVTEGESLVANPDSSSADWMQSMWPTPGEPNPEFGNYSGPVMVRLNEVLPHCYDDSVQPSDDWIELYNHGSEATNLSRWSITNEDGETLIIRHDKIWNVSDSDPMATIIQPGGYAVIQAPVWFVSGYGDSMVLNDPNGITQFSAEWTVTTDCKTLGPDFDDLTADWTTLLWPTPGQENPNPDDYNFDANIQFTRLMPYQTDYNDRNNEFFEITNFGSNYADLTNWKITKTSSGGVPYNATFTNLVLSPGESAAITPDADSLGLDGGFPATSALDVMTSALYLTDSGGTLQLYNPQDNLVDAVAWKDAMLPIDGWSGPAITNPNVSTTGLIYLRGDGCGSSLDSNTSADWQIKWSRLGASHLCSENTFSTTGTITPVISPTGALGELLQFIDSAQSNIHVHVYQLYSAEIVFALKSALQRGVDVTVVLNEPEYSWSGYDEDRQYGMASEINDAGGTVFLIGEPLDDSAPPSPYPYFHSKIAVKDNETVWIGSGNWKSSSHPTSDYSGNREWGMIIENSDIAEMILQRMEWDENPLHNHVLSYQSSMKPNGWTTPIPVGDQQPYGEFTPYTGSFSGKILTCPDDCMEGLVESINSADESIHLSLASFDLDWYWGWGENPILEALKQRAETGVKIHMVIDDTYSNPETREAIDMFNNDWNRTNGWDTSAVIMNTDSVVDSLHNKGMIIDGESVLISSINWNANSILRNREMGIIIDSEEIASVYLSSWQSDWDRLDDNTDSDGDTLPDYWEVQFGLNRTNAYITGSTSGEEDIDSENDSLINSLELLYGGNPTLADTDGDCIPDGKEAIWAMSLENLSNQAKIEFAKLAISSTDADNNSVNDGIQFECGINFDGTTTVELIDSDGDSVPDQDDQCSETPAGTVVNIYGCPLNTQIEDQDGDGIADSLDECPDTPANTGVSVYGCSDQQSRDKASSVTNEEDDSSKSNFFLLIIVFSGLLLCGSLFGIMRNRSNEDYEMADLSNEKVSLGSEDWEEVTLDASIMPVLDGTSESNVSAAEEPSIDNSLFPGWTEDVIQTYIDQGWSIEQLKDWYDQHS